MSPVQATFRIPTKRRKLCASVSFIAWLDDGRPDAGVKYIKQGKVSS
ncbi:MAG: hypothetical protein QOE17_248 [Gaiellales bacterium]|nr:hypothetical protein [Gaiellales bacterium]